MSRGARGRATGRSFPQPARQVIAPYSRAGAPHEGGMRWPALCGSREREPLSAGSEVHRGVRKDRRGSTPPPVTEIASG